MILTNLCTSHAAKEKNYIGNTSVNLCNYCKVLNMWKLPPVKKKWRTSRKQHPLEWPQDHHNIRTLLPIWKTSPRTRRVQRKKAKDDLITGSGLQYHKEANSGKLGTILASKCKKPVTIPRYDNYLFQSQRHYQEKDHHLYSEVLTIDELQEDKMSQEETIRHIPMVYHLHPPCWSQRKNCPF